MDFANSLQLPTKFYLSIYYTHYSINCLLSSFTLPLKSLLPFHRRSNFAVARIVISGGFSASEVVELQ